MLLTRSGAVECASCSAFAVGEDGRSSAIAGMTAGHGMSSCVSATSCVAQEARTTAVVCFAASNLARRPKAGAPVPPGLAGCQPLPPCERHRASGPSTLAESQAATCFEIRILELARVTRRGKATNTWRDECSRCCASLSSGPCLRLEPPVGPGLGKIRHRMDSTTTGVACWKVGPQPGPSCGSGASPVGSPSVLPYRNRQGQGLPRLPWSSRLESLGDSSSSEGGGAFQSCTLTTLMRTR
jgi:hypothetical protein